MAGVTKGAKGGSLGPEADRPRGAGARAPLSRMPEAYLDDRTAAFVKMSQGAGKPHVWGAGKKDK